MKPNLFRWVLKNPNSEEWIYNGVELYHFVPEKKTAIHFNQLGNRVKDLTEIVDMILNFDALLSRYQLEKAERIDSMVRIFLKSKNSSEILSAQVLVDPKISFVKSVRLDFRGQNYTEFFFTKIDGVDLAQKDFSLPTEIKITQGL